MNDKLEATFSVIDFEKEKLTLAPETHKFEGEADAGWTMDVAQTPSIFAFLKKDALAGSMVYISVSYALE